MLRFTLQRTASDATCCRSQSNAAKVSRDFAPLASLSPSQRSRDIRVMLKWRNVLHDLSLGEIEYGSTILRHDAQATVICGCIVGVGNSPQLRGDSAPVVSRLLETWLKLWILAGQTCRADARLIQRGAKASEVRFPHLKAALRFYSRIWWALHPSF